MGVKVFVPCKKNYISKIWGKGKLYKDMITYEKPIVNWVSNKNKKSVGRNIVDTSNISEGNLWNISWGNISNISWGNISDIPECMHLCRIEGRSIKD